MKPLIDLTGQSFGRLTVLYRDMRPSVRTRFMCQCRCGKQVPVQSAHLLQGHTTSCGCWSREATGQRSTRHNASHRGQVTTEYRIWTGIMNRCYNPRNKSYANYGGRGITVAEPWHDFVQFLADMGLRPSTALSVERRDNNGPYSADNCLWGTRMTQANNRRDNVLLTLGTETHTLSEWADLVHIPRKVLYDRHRKLGWSDARTLTTPVKKR